MISVAATVRRLIAPLAWPLALVFLMGCSATLAMFMPERIDHHGWQLAMLAVSVAGLCDPKSGQGWRFGRRVERGVADDRAGADALCGLGGGDHRVALGVGRTKR